ncbi:DUF6266 family protein [Pedobacter metabolipauper]|uniref:Uncharacterized protein n=1 Tax=Pedobacter metabolipauper TaxID=425513 RepID=A0A4R6SPV3_9SPHI|nr:DUF6266 family protein [Pedobacter metabolipauper]TDQ06189.1 hypothetical protein ATK78_4570 [Pedobacter metabolipauper]
MGKLNRGFLGGFRGRLGPAYGCFWRGMDLVKTLPRKSGKPGTPKQLVIQQKLAVVTGFLSGMGPLIEIGFKGVTNSGESAMNAAVSYNIQNAVTGIAPNFVMDYTKLKYSFGKLPLPNEIQVTMLPLAKLEVNWSPRSYGVVKIHPDDLATFVVYNPEKNTFVVLEDAARRDETTYTIQMPSEFIGDTVFFFMNFITSDGKLVSENSNLGNLVILP